MTQATKRFLTMTAVTCAIAFTAGESASFAAPATTTTTTTKTTTTQTSTAEQTAPSASNTVGTGVGNAGGTAGGQLSDPQYPMNVPATSRSEAMLKARVGAGRINPFAQPAGAFKPLFDAPEIKQPKALPKVHVPPPPKFTLAPPPPPTETILPGLAAQSVGQAGTGAIDAQMPEPPEKPLIAEKMKLVGVLADRAFFTFTDLSLRRANKFPSTVVLANGEQFESVHLVSVEPNSVVLEEDGERITKELERIR